MTCDTTNVTANATGWPSHAVANRTGNDAMNATSGHSSPPPTRAAAAELASLCVMRGPRVIKLRGQIYLQSCGGTAAAAVPSNTA